MKSFKITKKETLPRSEVVIEGELTEEAVNEEKNKALLSFQDRISLKGFRKGHVPEKVLIEKVGELAIYEESASMALEKAYEEIIKEADIHGIGRPRVSITKISLGNPVGFKIETAVMPNIKLPDYKKEAAEVMQSEDDLNVEDKEVVEALDVMRRSFAHHEKHHQEGASDVHEAHEDHTGKDIPETDLPLLNDDFAKKIGNFPSLDVLKEKIKESVAEEKKIKAKEKKRLLIIERIIEKSDPELPSILVESELNNLLSEFQGNLERMGIGFPEYLAHIKKEEADLRNELKPEAEKRAKIQIILKQISEDQGLKEDEELVKKETDSIVSQYKDVDRANVELYVRGVLLNEKVWEFLEEQK